MAVKLLILAVTISLQVIAFVFAVGAEQRRSSGELVPDEYDLTTYCSYTSDASTVYGLAAFGLLLISQTIINGVTKCLCFGKGLVVGRFKTCAIFFFIFSWVTFLGAESCLLAGSARNAYHTKYRADFLRGANVSCATLRKGVFAAGAALTLMTMLGSSLYYWAHSRADTGGWEKHHNEGGLDMGASDFKHHGQHDGVGNNYGKP